MKGGVNNRSSLIMVSVSGHFIFDLDVLINRWVNVKTCVFNKGLIVRLNGLLGQSIYKTAALVGCFQCAVVSVCGIFGLVVKALDQVLPVHIPLPLLGS